MTLRAAALRTRARAAARDALYSPPSRKLARVLAHDPRTHRVRAALEQRGHGEVLRRLASETLPRHTFYLRLRIRNWKKFDGREFRLLQGGRVVYGNQISAPPEGQPLEYRNIIVTSDDPSDFTLDLPVKHTIHVGRGAFSTEEQDSYDERYHVEQHGDVRYSVRGNSANPSRILVTFPGFPPANSRVSYAVSYLKALTDEDLEDALMVCFQDRYGVAGTYMLFDNAGRPLHDRVTKALTDLLSRYGLTQEDMLFFGASKGASIAAMTARDLPGVRQVLVVPQMNLPYYFSKPVLRHGLYRDQRVWDAEQPSVLLRRYLAEGRRIDWFYTDSDQDSNYSLIEYARDVPGLTKHRLNGAHASVAKKSLPTVLSILRAFAAGGDEDASPRPLPCGELVATVHEDGVEMSVRLEDVTDLKEAANVYLEGTLGGTRFRQLLTADEDPALRATAPKQRLDPVLHPVDALTRVIAFDGTTRTLAGELPAVVTDDGAPAPSTAAPIPLPEELSAAADEPRDYAVLGASNRPSTRVRYVSVGLDPRADRAELVVVPAAELPEAEAAEPHAAVRTRFVMAAQDGWRDLALLARRAALVARVDAIRVVLEDPDVPDRQVRALQKLYGVDVDLTDHRRRDAD